jgi:hypothetical protein
MNCENCGNEHDGTYGSGRFCSVKCSRGFSTKAKRKEINERVSKTLTINPYIIICKECKGSFQTKRKNRIFCSVKCARNFKFNDPGFIEKISKSLRITYKDPEKRKRLRDVGRKGGFGRRGFTKDGTRYESLLEKQCFEYLEKEKIIFEPHKNIPNSSKVSDVYLVEQDLWIEIDGIDREKRKKWLGKDYEYWLDKLEIYKREKLNYKIVYNLNELKDATIKETR